MNKAKLKVKVIGGLIGVSMIISLFVIQRIIFLLDNRPANIVSSSSAMQHTYITDIAQERDKYKADMSAIDRKYDDKINALRDKLNSYTDKSSKECYDCQCDLMSTPGFF